MLENLKYLSNKNLCDTQLYMNRLIGSMCIGDEQQKKSARFEPKWMSYVNFSVFSGGR